jgi:hypothetical protein
LRDPVRFWKEAAFLGRILPKRSLGRAAWSEKNRSSPPFLFSFFFSLLSSSLFSKVISYFYCLHTLLKFDKPQKQLQVEAIIDRNEKDLTLFDLIQQSKWAEAAAHVRMNPLTARHWITIARETGWRHLPLHKACIWLATLDFIGILIEAYPEAVEE